MGEGVRGLIISVVAGCMSLDVEIVAGVGGLEFDKKGKVVGFA